MGMKLEKKSKDNRIEKGSKMGIKLEKKDKDELKSFSFVEKVNTICYDISSTWHHPKFGGKLSIDRVLISVLRLHGRFHVAIRCYYCRALLASCEIIGEDLSGINWRYLIDKVRDVWSSYQTEKKLVFFKHELGGIIVWKVLMKRSY